MYFSEKANVLWMCGMFWVPGGDSYQQLELERLLWSFGPLNHATGIFSCEARPVSREETLIKRVLEITHRQIKFMFRCEFEISLIVAWWESRGSEGQECCGIVCVPLVDANQRHATLTHISHFPRISGYKTPPTSGCKAPRLIWG